MPRAKLPPLDQFTLLDKSNALVVETMVRLQEGKNIDLVTRGTSELLGFKDRMKPLVDLKAPERLALDTRVK